MLFAMCKPASFASQIGKILAIIAAFLLAGAAIAQDDDEDDALGISDLETLEDVDDFFRDLTEQVSELLEPDSSAEDEGLDEEETREGQAERRRLRRAVPDEVWSQLQENRRLGRQIDRALVDRQERAYASSIEGFVRLRASAGARAPGPLRPLYSLADCRDYFNLGSWQNNWGFPERAVASFRKARRNCKRLRYVPPSLDIALQGREAAALRKLSRYPEALSLFKSAYGLLRERKFRDTDVAAEVGNEYAALLATIGQDDAGRKILLELWNSVEPRSGDVDFKLRILTSLVDEASRRGSYTEALRWVGHAEKLLTTDALRQKHYYTVAFRRAYARWAALGPAAAERDYREIADRLSREKDAQERYADIKLSLGYVLDAAGKTADANRVMREVELLAGSTKTTPYVRLGHYSSLGSFYLASGDCSSALRTSKIAYDISKAGSIPVLWQDSARFGYSRALLQCGRSPEAFRLLNEPTASAKILPYQEASREWLRALALHGDGKHGDAVATMRATCDRYSRDTLGSQSGSATSIYTSEILLLSAATCARDLSALYWASARQNSGTAAQGDAAHALTGPLAESFLAAQTALQTQADDGVSLALAMGAARRVGGRAPELVSSYEELSRRLADRQRDLENSVLLGASGVAQIEADIAKLRAQRDQARDAITRLAPGYWRERMPQPVQAGTLTGAAGPAILRDGETLILLSLSDTSAVPSLIFALSTRGSDVAAIRTPPRQIKALIARLRDAIRPREESGDKGARVSLAQFDRSAAIELHKILFSDERIKKIVGPSHTILLVPSGEMRTLPLGVLVTRPLPDPIARSPSDFLATPWLLKEKAVAVFPTVSALVQLRQTESRATALGARRFLGIANPSYGQQAEAAPEVQLAEQKALGRTAAASAGGYPVLTPLGQISEKELTQVGALMAPGSRVVSGPNATEAWFKGLAASGALEQIDVLAFATHGLLPSQSGPLIGEPALALAKPDRPGAEDGLLTASEIARMRFGAALIMLSACETGSDESGRSLAALSRAFLQAGARSLLITHWPIRNDLGGAILPRMLEVQRASPDLSLAQALQRASLDVMNDTTLHGAHPAQWAAFTLIGDGGRLPK
jgi:CHAT domain-containing protein